MPPRDRDTDVSKGADAALGQVTKALGGKPRPKKAADADAAVRGALAKLGDSKLKLADEAPKRKGGQKAAADRSPITRPNGDPYIPRLLEGADVTDVDLLRSCRDAGIPVLLAGRPGCGKTAAIEAAFGEELLTVHAHADLEVADMVGAYSQRPDGTYQWNDGPLVVAMREGRPLFVDDATLAPPGVLARMYPAMDGRNRIAITEHEGEAAEAAPGFVVVGAHNPGAPGALLSEALASRFLVQVEVESDLVAAIDLGVDRKVVDCAYAMRKMRDAGTVGWAPEMRELLAFLRVHRAAGMEIALGNLISAAPEEERNEVARQLATRFPNLRPRALAVRMPDTL